MAGRRFDVADVVEVIQHWQAGGSGRGISRALGMGRDRVGQILAVAERAGLSKHGPRLTSTELRERVPELFAARMSPLGSRQQKKLEPLHARIVAMLETNTTQTVWQRLRDEHGLDISVRTFRRYVDANVRGISPDRITVPKEKTLPGEVAEVDYGRMGIWMDPITGRKRVMQAFVMTLVYSRRIFINIVDCCDQMSWVRSHVAAFEFFGGAPQKIRLDNLKTGVLRADIYDPQLNRAYAEMAEHYGVLLDPCRVAKPKDKAQVERAVPYVRDSFWRGRDFTDWVAIREGALRWCTNVADARPHHGLPGTVGDVFVRVERPSLLALPTEPFELAHWAKATLHPDCHVQVLKHFYSASWKLVGRQLDVRVGERLITVYDSGQLVKTHIRKRGQRRYTDPADFPEQKIAFLQKTPAWCRRRALDLGSAVAALTDELLTGPYPLSRLREAQSLIRLGDTYPAERIDAACQRSLAADGRYRTVKNILAKRLDIAVDADATHVSKAGAFLHGQQVLLEYTR
jgi:transposase